MIGMDSSFDAALELNVNVLPFDRVMVLGLAVVAVVVVDMMVILVYRCPGRIMESYIGHGCMVRKGNETYEER